MAKGYYVVNSLDFSRLHGVRFHHATRIIMDASSDSLTPALGTGIHLRRKILRLSARGGVFQVYG